jgi:hypothetical protein
MPAARDAVTIARLKRAGFVVGRTNMPEFAFSGLGLNPHYGTPKGIWDRDTSRVPGGSSSGAAISVADGTAHGAIGTNTGGFQPTGRLQADCAPHSDAGSSAAVLDFGLPRPAGAVGRLSCDS